MACHMDSICNYYTPKERQFSAVPEQRYHKPYQPSQYGDFEKNNNLNKPQQQAEEIIAEERTGFSAVRSITD